MNEHARTHKVFSPGLSHNYLDSSASTPSRSVYLVICILPLVCIDCSCLILSHTTRGAHIDVDVLSHSV